MAIILNIETATQVCSVALAKDGKLLALRELNEKNVHAEVLTLFVQEVIKEAQMLLKDIDAVAVSQGPGSYTGLRIGMSTAKGLCYSLDKPLIGISTLNAMAQFAKDKLIEKIDEKVWFSPMIDARRMEVYSAFYDINMEEQSKIAPHILNEDSFTKTGRSLILTGDGCEKTKALFKNRIDITIYSEILCSARGMMVLSEKKFQDKNFEDLAYFEPFYLKEFIAGIPRVKGLR